jgi:hypothetical protein
MPLLILLAMLKWVLHRVPLLLFNVPPKDRSHLWFSGVMQPLSCDQAWLHFRIHRKDGGSSQFFYLGVATFLCCCSRCPGMLTETLEVHHNQIKIRTLDFLLSSWSTDLCWVHSENAQQHGTCTTLSCWDVVASTFGLCYPMQDFQILLSCGLSCIRWRPIGSRNGWGT